MNCSNCGASMRQGPNGDWACPNCGGTGTTLPPIDRALLNCTHCGWSVHEGPQGGYVCGQCYYTVPPPPSEQAVRAPRW